MDNSAKRMAIRLYIVLLCLYFCSPFGATFHGTVIPDSQPLTFGLIALSLMLWLANRRGGRWRWRVSSLDATLPLWAIAIVASSIANPETASRSAIGLWFVLLYVGTWYVLHDLVTNYAAAREWLIDGLLSAGILLMLFSLLQMLMSGRWLQPVSLIGNANALGTVMLVVVPIAIGRMLATSRLLFGIIWAAYATSAVAIVMLTLSRGAWLGLIAAVCTLLVLYLQGRNLLSIGQLRRRWRTLGLTSRRFIFAGATIAVLVVGLLLGLVLNSFSIRERRAELRGEIWVSALLQFAEKPLTGRGLFTFGYHYNRHVSVPPALAYAHAHSLPLNIAAELGILGIVVLVVTVSRVVGSFRRAWSIRASEDRIPLLRNAAAIVGFGVHHIFDTTSMMPAVALLGLLLLVTLPAPEDKLAMVTRGRRFALQTGTAVLWIAVIFFGWRGSEVNRRYLQALRLSDYGATGRTAEEVESAYRNALSIMDEVVAREPEMPAYLQQQAFLSGLLAAQGDPQALDEAIAAFERFLAMEPDNAISWANLAALYWQSGDRAKAVIALESAVALAPKSGLFVYNLATYLGIFSRDKIDLPHSGYNQEFTRFQFLRESLPVTFLPQVGWGNR